MSFKSVLFGTLFSTPQKNGLTRPKAVRGTGMPMVNMGELFAHPRIENLAMDLVPVSDGETHFLLEPEDLLFARQSLVLEGAGQCSIFIGNAAPTVFESHLIRCRLNRSISNPHFYFYYFRSSAGRAAIETIAEQGAGASGIRGSDLVKLAVPCPPKAQQDAIASVLSALDDRITVLRETNATLESIAQALFKSWFVDFDPVRARMEGRIPEGLDETTTALFPRVLEESELGLVPKGWKIGPLLDMATLMSGGTPKTDRPEYWGGDISWASAKDVSQSAASVLIKTERTITIAGVENSATRIIPALATVVVARGATTGRMVMLGEPMAMNQTCYALRSKHDTPVFLNLLFRTLVAGLLNAAHGSVFDTITTATFAHSRCVQPPPSVLKAFESVAMALMSAVVNNVQKIESLAAVRDTLLPRMISGQLLVSEAVELVAEV